jgi:hypothetical protein
MVQSIAALYSDHAHAQAAIDELKRGGHIVESTAKVTDTAATHGESEHDLESALIAGGIGKHDATSFAEGIRGGGSLVTVEPLFGRGAKTIGILDAHGPIDPGIKVNVEYIHNWNAPAPFSAFIGMQVLLDEPAPLSAKLGWRVFSDEPAPLSAKFGWRVLLDEAAPLSNKLKWPVLTEEAAPLSGKLGWKTLLDNPTPLSSKFGWKVLKDDATPLSTWLNWKVLWDNPFPLSSWLKLPLLSERKFFLY